jgi:hypothetical protein
VLRTIAPTSIATRQAKVLFTQKKVRVHSSPSVKNLDKHIVDHIPVFISFLAKAA